MFDFHSSSIDDMFVPGLSKVRSVFSACGRTLPSSHHESMYEQHYVGHSDVSQMKPHVR